MVNYLLLAGEEKTFVMQPWTIVLIVIAVILVAATIVLYFVGKKMEKKQNEQQQMMEANKQTVSMLVIDKKKVKFKDAGFPQAVIDQTPKMSRGMKVCAVKVKVGPQILTMIADNNIFDAIPVKKEIKATISGMYIMNFKAAHGKIELPPPKKKNIFQKAADKVQELGGAKPLK